MRRHFVTLACIATCLIPTGVSAAGQYNGHPLESCVPISVCDIPVGVPIVDPPVQDALGGGFEGQPLTQESYDRGEAAIKSRNVTRTATQTPAEKKYRDNLCQQLVEAKPWSGITCGGN